MRLLLDTHVFLWYITANPKLPATFRAAVQDPANEVYLSAASVWEAVIKHGLGKLPLPGPPADYLPHSVTPTGLPACRWTRGQCPTWPHSRRCTATHSTGSSSPRRSSTG